jgi:hypothetical protein
LGHDDSEGPALSAAILSQTICDPDTPPDMEPYVWLYDLAERRWRRRAPKNVAALRHYYAYRDKDEQLVNVIEPHLADVESHDATLIRKLASRTPLTERE